MTKRIRSVISDQVFVYPQLHKSLAHDRNLLRIKNLFGWYPISIKCEYFLLFVIRYLQSNDNNDERCEEEKTLYPLVKVKSLQT